MSAIGSFSSVCPCDPSSQGTQTQFSAALRITIAVIGIFMLMLGLHLIDLVPAATAWSIASIGGVFLLTAAWFRCINKESNG